MDMVTAISKVLVHRLQGSCFRHSVTPSSGGTRHLLREGRIPSWEVQGVARVSLPPSISVTRQGVKSQASASASIQ